MDAKTPPSSRGPSEPFGGSPPYQTPFPSAAEEKERKPAPSEGGERSAGGEGGAVPGAEPAGTAARPRGGTAAPRQAVPPARAPVRPGEVHDRLTIFVVRALFFFVAGWW